jgi:hypothetical protein
LPYGQWDSHRTKHREPPGTTGIKDRNGCDQDNGDLTLPARFCASVFADHLGHARHLTVTPDGVVYVNTWSSSYTGLKNAPGRFGNEVQQGNPATASEDFSVFARTWNVPSVFWFVGGTDPKKYAEAEQAGRLNDLPSNHSPQFAPIINPHCGSESKRCSLRPRHG